MLSNQQSAAWGELKEIPVRKPFLQLRDPRQMMIFVFGDEEYQIDDADSHLQSRMLGSALHKGFVISIEPPDEFHSLPAKLREDVFNHRGQSETR
jgi:hypothetical protein